jgi:hypothetical protein
MSPSSVVTFVRCLEIGEVASHEALAVVPLRAVPPLGPAYWTFEEANADHSVAVTEISPQGTVPVLRVHVQGDRPVLLVEGEVLTGGKQTRILNTTVLARTAGHTDLPVSCVERGRWRESSSRFGTSASFGSSSLRSKKSASVSASLKRSPERPTAASYASDQGEVWREVARTLTDSRAASVTQSFEAVRGGQSAWLEAASAALLPPLLATGSTVGCVAFVEGRAIAADAFDRPATFQRLARRLIEGYAIDAGGRRPGSRPAAPGRAAARAFLDSVSTATTTVFASPGLGSDHRIQGAGVTGFALEHQGAVLHLALFAGAPAAPAA